MIRYTIQISVRFLLFLIVAGLPLSGQQGDPWEQEVLKRLSPHIRWENIEGSPYWLEGPKPIYKSGSRRHVVTLAPGETVTLQVGAGEILRCVSEKQNLTPGDIILSRSDGSGLHVEESPFWTAEGRTFVIVPPWYQSAIFKIKHPDSPAGAVPVSLSFFVSKWEFPRPLVEYDRTIPVPAAQEGGKPGFKHLNAGEAVEFTVTGPLRLRVDSRLHYPLTATQPRQIYTIRCFLDNNYYRTMEFHTTLDREESAKSTVRLPDQPLLVGAPRAAFLKIPMGVHHLRMISNGSLYLTITGVLANGAAEVLPEEASALELLKRRDLRETGITAASLVEQAFGQNPASPFHMNTAVRNVVSDIWFHHTVYRPLLPWNKADTSPQVTATFFDPSLRSPTATGKPDRRVIFGQFLENDVTNAATGEFFPLSSSEETVYYLPERNAPSRLRVVVARTGNKLKKKVQLMMRWDNSPPITLTLFPEKDVAVNRLEVSPVEALAAFFLSRPLEGLHFPSIYLQRIFPWFDGAVVEIPLPAPVRSLGLRVLQVQDNSNSTVRKPLYAALAYRTSRPYRMGDADYLQALKEHTGIENFKRLLIDTKGSEGEFGVHLQPLANFLNSRFRTFGSGLSPHVNYRLGNSKGLKAQEAAGLIEEAMGFESMGQWLNALENWNRLLHFGSADYREQAKLGRLRALLQLEEPFLTEQVLKGMVLFETDNAPRETAISRLNLIYSADGDLEKLLNLRVAEARLRPSTETVSHLCQALLNNGLPEFALTAGLFLPVERMLPEVLEDLLTAALSIERYDIFDYLLTGMPDSRRPYWMALLSISRGQYTEALALLEKAEKYENEQSQLLTSLIRDGLQLQGDLFAKEKSTRVNALARWEQWQMQLRQWGSWVWGNSPHLIRDCAGTATLYTIDRDLYAAFHVAKPRRPVYLELRGPVRLNLQLRALNIQTAPSSTSETVNSNSVNNNLPDFHDLSVKITIDNKDNSRFIEVNRGQMSDSLHLVGPESSSSLSRRVGLKKEFPLDLGPGLHRIWIEPQSGPVLVRVYALQPAVPLKILPMAPLTAELNHLLTDSFNGFVSETDTDLCIPRNRSGKEVMVIPFPGDQSISLPLPLEMNSLPVSPLFSDSIEYEKPIITEEMKGAPVITNGKWEAVNSILGSAGVEAVTVNGWAPETPGLRVRRALLEPFSSQDIVLTSGDSLRINLQLLTSRDFTGSLWLESPDYLERRSIPVNCRLDGVLKDTIIADADYHSHLFRISIPPGAHVLSFHPVEKIPNHFIRVRFQGKEESGKEYGTNDAVFSEQVSKRYYYVASRQEPLKLKIVAPARLRIDEWRDGHTWTHYILIPNTVSQVALFPGGQAVFDSNSAGSLPISEQEYSLFRVFQEITGSGTGDSSAAPSLPEKVSWVEALPYPLVNFSLSEPKKTVLFRDAFSLGRQEDATWSLQLGYHDYRPILEENEESIAEDHYSQVRVWRRFYNPRKSTYSSSNISVRFRSDGNPTLGLGHRLYFRPPRSHLPLALDFNVSGYLQKPSLDRKFIPVLGDSSGTDRLEWSFKVQGRMIFRHRFGTALLHQPGVELFARLLSINSDSFPSNAKVDGDVYTLYKKNHPFGLVLEDLLIITPWERTRWWLEGGVTSNEALNPFKPDYVTARFWWKQVIGWGQLDLLYRWRRYFRDDDRNAPRTSQLLSVQFQWDIWLRNRQRLELGAGFAREWGLKKNTFSLFVTWHLGKGRDYLDFNPAQLDFKDYKERRLFFKPDLNSNRMGERP